MAASSTESGAPSGNALGTARASRTTSGMPTPVAVQGAWSSQAPRGGRSMMIRPSSISTIRSAHGTTSSTRCSMTITPVPCSRASPRSVPSTSCAPTGSRSDSGSSSTSTRGRIASVAAMAVRCFWPPDSVSTVAVRSAVSWVTASAQLTLAAISCCGSARFSGPNATSDCTVMLISCRFGFWNTSPTCWAASCGASPDSAWPPKRTAPRSSPCTRAGISPASARASVDLPQPDAPVIRTSSPGPTARSTCRSAALAAPG